MANAAMPGEQRIVPWVAINSVAIEVEVVLQAISEGYYRPVGMQVELEAQPYEIGLAKGAQDLGIRGPIRLRLSLWHEIEK